MPRKRSTSDFAITMDEFHPSPSIAAAFADRNANEAAMKNLLVERQRLIRKRDSAQDMSARRAATRELEENLMLSNLTVEDRKEIDRIIQEAKVK
jgi:hypothetical protein